MLIRYLGEYTKEKRSYGCSRCGTGSSYGGVETYKTRDRHYYNGRLIVFNEGEVVSVDETLGNYLLKKKYRDPNGYYRNAYELVNNQVNAEWVEGYDIPALTEQPKLTKEELEFIERERRKKATLATDAVSRTISANNGEVRVDKGEPTPTTTQTPTEVEVIESYTEVEDERG